MSPPFGAVTNRLTMYAASLERVYTAGGFLSNSGGRTESSAPTHLVIASQSADWRGNPFPYKGKDGFPRQCEQWLGMTARRCRADGTSGTPSPTKSQRGRCKKGGQSRPPLRNGTSYPKGICSAALHCRTPSPTKSQRGRCKKGRTGVRPLHSYYI